MIDEGSEIRFKYDIAFSLLSKDAQLAEALADELAPLKCFVFTQRQRDLVGRDSVEAFAEVFRSDARLAVVLYRSGYGETEYTDLEARGIQDRGMETGWESPVLINLDGSQPPSWYPKRNIWLDLKRYPLSQAVGAIRLRAEQLGARRKAETASEVLDRLARRKADEKARKAHEDSPQAVLEVAAEVTSLFGDLGAIIEARRDVLGRADPVVIVIPSGLAVATRFGSAVVEWRFKYRDSLAESGLYVKEFDGYVSIGDHRAARAPRLLSDVEFKPWFSVHRTWNWSPDDGSAALSTTELREQILKRLFEGIFTRMPP